MQRAINVAEAKRKFSELLARTAYAGERFVISRRGRPLAALVAIEDLTRLETRRRGTEKDHTDPQGLLAAAKALADYEDFEKIMAGVARGRRRSTGRPIRLG